MWEYRRNTQLFSLYLSRLSLPFHRSCNARNFSACIPLSQETFSHIWIGWKFWRNPWRVPNHRMRCKYRPIIMRYYIIILLIQNIGSKKLQSTFDWIPWSNTRERTLKKIKKKKTSYKIIRWSFQIWNCLWFALKFCTKNLLHKYRYFFLYSFFNFVKKG